MAQCSQNLRPCHASPMASCQTKSHLYRVLPELRLTIYELVLTNSSSRPKRREHPAKSWPAKNFTTKPCSSTTAKSPPTPAADTLCWVGSSSCRRSTQPSSVDLRCWPNMFLEISGHPSVRDRDQAYAKMHTGRPRTWATGERAQEMLDYLDEILRITGLGLGAGVLKALVDGGSEHGVSGWGSQPGSVGREHDGTATLTRVVYVVAIELSGWSIGNTDSWVSRGMVWAQPR